MPCQNLLDWMHAWAMLANGHKDCISSSSTKVAFPVPAQGAAVIRPFFFCRRPLPFGGSHLRLPSGPARIRTTTGSLSALARPTPYQLSHRVACRSYKTKIFPAHIFTVRLTFLFTTLVATRLCRCLLRSDYW